MSQTTNAIASSLALAATCFRRDRVLDGGVLSVVDSQIVAASLLLP